MEFFLLELFSIYWVCFTWCLRNYWFYIVDVREPFSPKLLSIFSPGDYHSFIGDFTVSKDDTKVYISCGYTESGESSNTDDWLSIIDLNSAHYSIPDDTYGDNYYIPLKIFSNQPVNLKIKVSSSNEDFVTIGDYDHTLSYEEYHNKIIKIPLISEQGKRHGYNADITISFTHNNKTIIRVIHISLIDSDISFDYGYTVPLPE